MQTLQILIVHSMVVGLLLFFWLYWLSRKGLFRWTTAGFWAWAAFVLYFVLNPLLSAISGDYLWYDITLQIAGREARAAWIGVIICVGISAFFVTYLRTKSGQVFWKLAHPTHYPLTIWFFIILCLALGLPALLTFRIGLFGGSENVLTQQGRFVGDVTGYQYSAHTFLLVPAVFLILTSRGIGRLLGWVILGLYVLASFADPWSRFLAISALLAISFIDLQKRSKRWPRLLLVILILFTATILRLRGHTSFQSTTDFWTTAVQVPANVIDTFASGDSAMLATFYLESYTRDTLAGYDYGIPLINYSLTGLLPSKFFQWKYFLIDELRRRQDPRIGSELLGLLYGSKSSLIGSFYSEGGLIGVLLLMTLAGFLSRKLDGMLSNDVPPLVLATGIVWMSLLWMVWGSTDYWALTTMGMVALPTIGIWLLSPKILRKGVRRVRPAPFEPSPGAPSVRFADTYHSTGSRK